MLAPKSRGPARRPSPAVDMQHLQETLARTSRLDVALRLFDRAIAGSGATCHHCSRLVLEHYAAPLFGDAEHHAPRISRLARAGGWDIETPLLLPAATDDADAIFVVPVPILTGDPLVISIGYEESDAEAVGRQDRAMLHGLSIVYAHRALMLWEIEQDIQTETPLTLNERFTFAMLLCGYPQFRIAMELDCSPASISAWIVSATEKLKVADSAAAIALAARRGWLHLPNELGKHQRGIDS